MSCAKRYFRLCEDIHHGYLWTLDHPINHQPKRKVMPDPNSELAVILAYAQSAFAYIQNLSSQIAALQAASTANPAPTDSDSPDVETAIQNILAFQADNPIPAPPVAVAPAPTSTPSAS